MKISNRQQGQTLIETALILLLLLVIVLGIEEFARAWYTKNSIKNAARQGARVAVVTPSAPITQCAGNANLPCNETRTFTPCPGSNIIINSVCDSPGVSYGSTRVVMCYIESAPSSPSLLNTGDTVNVCVRTDFTSAIPTNFPWLGDIIPDKLYGDASMRYE